MNIQCTYEPLIELSAKFEHSHPETKIILKYNQCIIFGHGEGAY